MNNCAHLPPGHRAAGGGGGVQPGRLPAFREHHLENIRRANQEQSATVWNRGGQVRYFSSLHLKISTRLNFEEYFWIVLSFQNQVFIAK